MYIWEYRGLICKSCDFNDDFARFKNIQWPDKILFVIQKPKKVFNLMNLTDTKLNHPTADFQIKSKQKKGAKINNI